MLKDVNDIFGKNITNPFKFHSVTQSHIVILAKQIGIKKANGIDKIPAKLEKLSANIFSWSVNDSLSSGIFPDAAKMAAIRALALKNPFLNLGR